MAELFLSQGEKVFIKNGIKRGTRQDGRGVEDFRPLELETQVVPHCYGSARLKLANTDVMVGVKGQVTEPSDSRPKHGKLEFFVDCSAIATPDFEGQGGSELADCLATTMATLYDHPHAIDTTLLSIVEGKKCWCLNVDILLLEIGGNLYDSVAMCVKAALFDTRIPNLIVIAGEHGGNDLELPDDPADCFSLHVDDAPCLLSLNKIGDAYIVDTSMEEESCVTSRVILGVRRDGCVVMVKKDGVEGLEVKSVSKITQMGSRVGGVLNESLLQALKKEASILNNRQLGNRPSISGFVK